MDLSVKDGLELALFLGTTLVAIGAWKGRREAASDAVTEIKADLETRMTSALCDDRHSRSQDELSGVRRQLEHLDATFATRPQLEAIEKTMTSRMDTLERTLFAVQVTVQSVDQRTARIEGQLTLMTGSKTS